MTYRWAQGSIQARTRLVAIIAIGLLALLASGTEAQSERNAAGLVVRHADGSFVYAYVEFDRPSISGEELLLRAGLDVTMAPYGGLGAGVCSIDGEGCPADNCFCESYSSPAYFWQYFAYENGEWRAQPLGPSSREVSDGDIDGWSWTAGDHGLPAVTIDEIARIAGVVPEPTATPTPLPAPTATPVPSPTPTVLPTATETPEPDPVEPTPTEPSPTPTSTAAVEPTASPTPTPTATIATPTTKPTATTTGTPTSTALIATSTPEPTSTPARAAVAVDPSGTVTALDSAASESGGDDLVLFGAVAGGVILVGAGALVLRRRQVS